MRFRVVPVEEPTGWTSRVKGGRVTLVLAGLTLLALSARRASRCFRPGRPLPVLLCVSGRPAETPDRPRTLPIRLAAARRDPPRHPERNGRCSGRTAPIHPGAPDRRTTPPRARVGGVCDRGETPAHGRPARRRLPVGDPRRLAPGPALVVGPVLIAGPYAAARALSNRITRWSARR